MELTNEEKIWMLGVIGAIFDIDGERKRYKRVEDRASLVKKQIEQYNGRIMENEGNYPENIYNIGEELAYKIIKSLEVE
jgi:hypothetical protein